MLSPTLQFTEFIIQKTITHSPQLIMYFCRYIAIFAMKQCIRSYQLVYACDVDVLSIVRVLQNVQNVIFLHSKIILKWSAI